MTSSYRSVRSGRLYPCLPSLRVIYFAEYGGLLAVCAEAVAQLVRCIFAEFDIIQIAIRRTCFLKCLLSPCEVVPDDSCRAEICRSEQSDFLIRCRSRYIVLNKPAVAVSIFVIDRSTLRIHDYISAVKQGNHLEFCHRLFNILNCSGTFNHSVEITDFARYVFLYKILVSLKLDRTVSSDTFVVIALDRVIEGVHAQIEYAIIKILILVNYLIHHAWFVVGCKVLRCDEMTLVEVALSYACKVYPYKDDDSNRNYAHSACSYEGSLRADCVCLRLSECPRQECEYAGNQDERADGVLLQECRPVCGKSVNNDFAHAGIATSHECSCDARNQHAK